MEKDESYVKVESEKMENRRKLSWATDCTEGEREDDFEEGEDMLGADMKWVDLLLEG